jgi:hypothetical protein
VLATLSQARGGAASREFVMRDVDGRVDKIRVDLTHDPELLRVLDTTARPATQDDTDSDTDREPEGVRVA